MGYSIALLLHSYVRWAIVALWAVSLALSARGWRGRAPWRRRDDGLATAFLSAVDTQVLLGILLWLVWSPFGDAFRANPRAAMHDAEARFWGMEHEVSMLLAFVVAHVGRAIGKRRGLAWGRHRVHVIALVVFGVLVAAAFPWPWSAHHARAWFRLP